MIFGLAITKGIVPCLMSGGLPSWSRQIAATVCLFAAGALSGCTINVKTCEHVETKLPPPVVAANTPVDPLTQKIIIGGGSIVTQDQKGGTNCTNDGCNTTCCDEFGACTTTLVYCGYNGIRKLK